MRKILTTVIFFVFLLCPFVSRAVTLIPPLMDKEVIDPGQSAEMSFQIRNDFNYPQTYYFNAANMNLYGEEGGANFDEQIAGTEDLASWIEFENNQLGMKPGELKDFDFKINVPDYAEPGGHYAAIFVSTKPGEVDQSGVGIRAKTGVLLFVTVSGDIIEELSVEEFSLEKKFYTRPPVDFVLRLKNTGTVHHVPNGNIVLKSMLGREKALVDANPKRSYILPDSIRKYHPTWRSDLPTEKQGFFKELMLEIRNFSFGRYSANLEINYGSEGGTIEDEVSFWVMPWRLMLLVLIILILIVLYLKGYRKNVEKKKK